MSDRDILLHWLAAAAARLGWSRRVRELGWFACALVALPLLAELLEAVGAPAPVRSALFPLLVLAGLAVLALLVWRLAGSTTLAQAAGVADTRAGLKDELKSAHWFAQRGARDAFVELLLMRAAHTAQRLDARRLFPLQVPRTMFAALALAILTGALMWFSPRLALPVVRQPVPPSTASGDAHNARVAEIEAEKIAAELAASDAEAKRDPSAAWAQLEQMTNELLPGPEENALRRATAERDARLVAQLLHALRNKRADAAQPDAAAHPAEKASNMAAQRSSDERPPEESSIESKAPREPAPSAATEATARVRDKLGEQRREERRKLEGQPAQGDVTADNRLRAISRNSASMREVAYGEGEAAEAGSRTSVSGAAIGERTGKSRSGGSEGEQPPTGPTGDADGGPVLGQQTMRLKGELQKTRMERNDPQDVEEAFYAATQRQASQVGYETSMMQWQLQRETAFASSAIPLSYREGVKRYFLLQLGKED